MLRGCLGVSTWDKPAELEGIDFTDPVPDIEQVKENIKSNQPLNPKSPVNEELDYNDIVQDIDSGIQTFPITSISPNSPLK